MSSGDGKGDISSINSLIESDERSSAFKLV